MIGFVPCNIKLIDGEVPVQSGLAVTPADMDRMSLGNRAISSQASQVYNMEFDPPSNLPLAFRRGVDVNDAWELQKRLKRQLKDFRSKRNLDRVAAQSAAAVSGQEGV